MTDTLLTKEGAERLRQEINYIERTGRTEISDAIGRARALGDLSENAEYHAAKEKQGMMEARLRQLRGALGGAKVVDVQSLRPNGVVEFGLSVQLLKLDNEMQLEYQIVGELEADPKEGRISNKSPVAKALLGQPVGEIVGVATPNGEIEYEILAVRLPA